MAACQSTTRAEDSGDALPSPWEPPVEIPLMAECPGADYTSETHPMPYPGNPWWYIRSSISDVLDVWGESTDASTRTGCPAIAENDGAEVLSGDCTAEGVEFSGRWAAANSVREAQLEHVVVNLTGTDPAVQFQGDGRFRWLHNGDEYTVEADGYYSKATGGTLDGAFAFTGLSVEKSPTMFRAEGEVEVDWPYGHGNYCIVVDFVAAPDCAGEPDGYWALQGEDTWVIVADGSNRCDDCVEVFLNGAWEETFCDVYGTLL